MKVKVRCVINALLFTTLVLSTSVNAATVTHGYLVSDDTTDYITDTSTGRMYKRLDAYDFTYAETIASVSEGGIYEGWSIATSEIADDFYSAILGVTSTPCSGANPRGTACGTITGWNDGDFGNSLDEFYDTFWYMSSYHTTIYENFDIGAGHIVQDGTVIDDDDVATIEAVDSWRPVNQDIDALIYIDVAPVPLPPALWLFGTGLIGLIGLAKRKKA